MICYYCNKDTVNYVNSIDANKDDIIQVFHCTNCKSNIYVNVEEEKEI